MSAPALAGVHETCLYGADLPALTGFYAHVLGLRSVSRMGELGVAFRLPDGGVLLLFDPAAASAAGRDVPAHGATGAGHVAFTVARGTLGDWRAWLDERGVEVESEIAWNRGGRSLYVRDPAGNSVELIDGEIWPD